MYFSPRLRTLFVAGEHCDHETLIWAGKVLDVSIKHVKVKKKKRKAKSEIRNFSFEI